MFPQGLDFSFNLFSVSTVDGLMYICCSLLACPKNLPAQTTHVVRVPLPTVGSPVSLSVCQTVIQSVAPFRQSLINLNARRRVSFLIFWEFPLLLFAVR